MGNEGSLQMRSVILPQTLMDAREEIPFSGDYMLPEYCPDAVVVLKCRVTPYIQSRRWSGDQFLVEGTAGVQILYLDEERRCVRSAEFSQPISGALRGDPQAQAAPLTVEATVEYANCRAVSPRRLEVRGAIAVCVRARSAVQTELAEDTADEDLFLRRTVKPGCVPVAFAEKNVSLHEMMDFDSRLPEAEQLLGGDCTAVIRECKILSGKVIVKGQVYLHQIYTDDSVSGTVYPLDYILPFSQILDIEGAEEGQKCLSHVEVQSQSQRCAINPAGQNAVLEAEVRLLIGVSLYAETEVPLVSDVYHRLYPVEPQTRDISAVNLCQAFTRSATVQKSFDLPTPDLQEILDIRVTPTALPGRCADGNITALGRLQIAMLVRDADGTVGYYERTEDCTLEYPAPAADPGRELTVCSRMAVTDVHYTAASGKLELQIGIDADVRLWETVEERVVCGVTADTEHPYPPQRAAVKLYYARPEEKIWDIARDCHTSPEQIVRENGLPSGRETVGAKTVLLVPTV